MPILIQVAFVPVIAFLVLFFYSFFLTLCIQIAAYQISFKIKKLKKVDGVVLPIDFDGLVKIQNKVKLLKYKDVFLMKESTIKSLLDYEKIENVGDPTITKLSKRIVLFYLIVRRNFRILFILLALAIFLMIGGAVMEGLQQVV